jgi:uncharacterized protein YegL
MEQDNNLSVSQPMPDLNTHLSYGNVDVTNLDMEEVVNVTLLVDTSGSMSPYAAELNKQISDFIKWMQEFHQAPKLFLSMGRFDSDIEVLTGFQQVNNVKNHTFNTDGGSTKLFEGCLDFLKNVISQQQRALNAGILTKSIFFVITDGADNASKATSASEVKQLINFIQSDEATINTFNSALVGIGDRNIFEHAQQEMAIRKLFVIDPNLDEKENKKAFKEVFGWLSASVSSASTQPGALVF